MISPESLCKTLEKYGVLAMPASSTRCSFTLISKQSLLEVSISIELTIFSFSMRVVIHFQISEGDIHYALTCIKVNLHPDFFPFSFLCMGRYLKCTSFLLGFLTASNSRDSSCWNYEMRMDFLVLK